MGSGNRLLRPLRCREPPFVKISVSRTNPDDIDRETLERESLGALDWPLLLKALEARVGSVPGREKVRGFALAASLTEARIRQNETTELRRLLDDGISVPTGGLRDIRGHTASAEKGATLVARELLDVADTLTACHRLKEAINAHAHLCPTVQATAGRMHDLQDLTRLLEVSFTSSGDLSPETYPAVGQLRNRILALHQTIQNRLSSLLLTEELAPLAQDHYATMRGERYVVPLKVQARSMDVGIVHDTSGSGQTVFVEPRQVVPMNNELKVAEAELRRTEAKILANLSARVAGAAGRIRENLDLFAEIEVMYARARLSQDLEATPPVLSSRPLMRLRRVRHPILALRGLDVVPNDLSIGERHQAIILSGPNTGGKTVALKTMGLCALMARSGLHLPAESGSQVGFFENVLTDIGDRQTVEADLSTFSGHMLTLKGILEALGSHGTRTLVLIDEIAAGTDPAQGAVLARALLESFADTGARIVATTHYAELKTLPVEDQRFVNARVIYDPVRLCPTFRVEVGVPGRSFAFDVAERLGMPNRVVERARGWLEGGQRALEDLLGELEKTLSRVRDEKTLLERERKALEAKRREYAASLERLEKDKVRFQREAVAEFEREVHKAREQIRVIVRDLQRRGSDRLRRAGAARRRVEDVAAKVRGLAPDGQGRPERRVPWTELKPGTKVWISGMGKTGTVVAVPDQHGGMVETMVGGLRVKAWPEDLRRPPADTEIASAPRRPGVPERDTGASRSRPISVPPPPRPEELTHAIQTSTNILDLRGLRVDEALSRIDHFLDRAALRGDTIVFLIHGHGTGALKRATREHLEHSPYIVAFQPGAKHQGGDGVTVVGLG